jgi:2-methylaconitate cis-trans-isomerase PrpF
MSTYQRVSGNLTIQSVNASDQITISTSALTVTAPLLQYSPAPTIKSGAATLTAAEVAVGVVNTTGTTYTITLPTGTELDTYFAPSSTNVGFDFYIINTASGTVTVTVGASGMTSLGTLTVSTAASAHFRLRRTAANTYVLYRI